MDGLQIFSDIGDMQKINRITVLRVLREHSPLSRIELAEKSGLSAPTITRIVKELIDEGIVVEAGKAETQRGRTPVLLELNYGELCFIGIQLNRPKTDVVVSNLKGEVRIYVSDDIDCTDPKSVSAKLSEMVDSALIDGSTCRKNVLGIGVSVSGLVSSDGKTILKSDNLRWENVDMHKVLADYTDLPIVVENDAKASLLGELWLGNGAEGSTIVFISAGNGVGASLYYDGELLRGAFGAAGEIGHSPIVYGGKQCWCGNRGCLEAYVGLRQVQQEYRMLTSSSRKVLEAYHDGDPVAMELVRRAAEMLGRSILHCAYYVNPDQVIVGGKWLEAGDEFLAILRQTVREGFALDSSMVPDVSYSSLYPHTEVLAAVGLIINEFFQYR